MVNSSKTLSYYIAGEWIAPKDEQLNADINPSDTTQELARVPQGSAEIVFQFSFT